MEYKNLKTSSLIDKCISQNPLAWAEFVNRFSPLIRLSIKKALSRYSPGTDKTEEIKDIQQNILISLWNKNRLEEVKNRGNISYWLAIVSRNATINHLKVKRKEVLISNELFFEKLPSENIEKQIGKIEYLDRKVREIYNLLKPKEQIIFKLYFKKELGLEDISKIMKIPLGTVSSTVTRMRQKIKCSKI